MARLTTVPENPLEALGLAAGLGPTPLADTMLALLLARTIMAATDAGIFEAIADGPLTAPRVAARCNTDPRATERMLDALVGARYLRARDSAYRLAPVARRWLLRRSRFSLRDAILHRYLDLELMGHVEEFLRTGQPTRYHETMTAEQWGIYQRGQLSHARLVAPEVVRRLPIPHGARDMLDIGGAHGHFSVALCRRHAGLRATVLDLPQAVAQAAPLLAAERMGERVVHRTGDALSDDLGAEEYDLVLIGNLAHHLDDAANRALQQRAARALRPGGCCVVLDLLRADRPQDASQIGALTDLYFAVTSAGGAWSANQIAGWQRDAGLVPRKPIRLLTVPGMGMQAATKPTGPRLRVQ